MAIDVQFARFLISCRGRGVSFRHCIMLGRLHYYPGEKETRRLFKEAGLDPGMQPRFAGRDRFAEPFLRVLGAERVDSMDASNYEGATIVHDLNTPIGADLFEQFDLVCDGGTIEHVFNFPVVIKNCISLVKEGGHLILNTPANNYFGHGFYQFSPELLFQIFSAQNGMEVVRMVAVEFGPFFRWYEVANPAQVKSRVAITNRYPVSLFVLARKTAITPVLAEAPQQSDYVDVWSDASGKPQQATSSADRLYNFKRALLESCPRLIRFLEAYYWSSHFNRKFSFRNPRFFSRVKR